MNGKAARNLVLDFDAISAEVKEILVRGKRLRAGDSWSKLYAERAFKNQKVTSPKELKHHEQIVKQYVPHELTFRRCGVSLTSARTDTSTSCRLLATKTALLMSLMIPCFPPIISCGRSCIRCAGSAVHTFFFFSFLRFTVGSGQQYRGDVA